jgi:hypothetical protein
LTIRSVTLRIAQTLLVGYPQKECGGSDNWPTADGRGDPSAMLKVGETRTFTGNVTTLNWIGPRPPAEVERNLGYGPGRLGAGYWVLLLVRELTPDDFEFEGTTLRSGGRLGLPGATAAEDAARSRMHDQILVERGPAGYRALQEQALRSVKTAGPERIAKVLPETGHDPAMAPSLQYPMGGGGLQWTIKKSRPVPFLVAMHVDRNGLATTPTFSTSLAPGPNVYEHRARVMKYLEQAK